MAFYLVRDVTIQKFYREDVSLSHPRDTREMHEKTVPIQYSVRFINLEETISHGIFLHVYLASYKAELD